MMGKYVGRVCAAEKLPDKARAALDTAAKNDRARFTPPPPHSRGGATQDARERDRDFIDAHGNPPLASRLSKG